jgi:predicted nucleic-acid-binding protein
LKITPDTNLLVRLLVNDDERQNRLAREELDRAELIVLVLPTLCELAWVLSRGYRVSSRGIADAMTGLLESSNVVANRPAVEAGIALLQAGGDFADGAMAHEGRSLGADEFVSFDRKAVRLLASRGEPARLLDG